jgi:shikimate kinase
MEDKKLLFVCGFMSAGKTTHGKKLARNIGYHFIDLDQYTEKKYDKSITELFAEVGEDEFRNIETESLNECINDNQKTVIALGGGTPCFNNNIELLKKSGQLIYLKMDAEALLKRVFGIKANRPLLANQEEKDMLPYIDDLLEKRTPFYEQSDLTVYHNNLHEDEFKETVLNFIKK